MGAEIKDAEHLLAEWHRRCEETQYGHYTAERVCTRLNYLLGIPVVGLSALAGTSTFASLQETTNKDLLIATGFVSITAAVLASLQTFLRFSERAEQHRTVAAKYGAVKRHIEQMRTNASATEKETYDFMDSIRQQMDSLAEKAPGVSGLVFRLSKKHLRKTKEAAQR